jgi:hypothetical protein
MTIDGLQGDAYSLESHEFDAAGHRPLTVTALKRSVTLHAYRRPTGPWVLLHSRGSETIGDFQPMGDL